MIVRENGTSYRPLIATELTPGHLPIALVKGAITSMQELGKSRDPKILRSLQYFEAVARHGSVSVAAAEIGVSASAVSHQLRELAASLGENLIKKNGRGISLTAAGLRLSSRLAATFKDIDAIIAEAVGERRHNLRLGVCSSFGPGWMAPRVPDFMASHWEIDLELRLYSQDPEQTAAVADAFVTALPVQHGFEAVPMFDEMLVAVQAPASLAAQLHTPHRLITTDIVPGQLGAEWKDYSAQTETRLADFSAGEPIQCTHYLLALELAKAGVGLALVPDFLAAEALANGRLIYFDRSRVFSGRTYNLCYKTARASDPSIRALARWMKAQAGGAVLHFPNCGKTNL